MTPLEKNSEELADITLNWYVNIVKENYVLKDIFNQFVRSATSIGANIAESKFSQSSNDYKSKMSIALKEANESKYWMIRLEKINMIDKKTKQEMEVRIDNILRMLISLCKKE